MTEKSIWDQRNEHERAVRRVRRGWPPLTIPEWAWVPCGPEEDPRAVLQCAFVINGVCKLYMEAYAVHDNDCDDPKHATNEGLDDLLVLATHGALGDATAFDRLAEEHGLCVTVREDFLERQNARSAEDFKVGRKPSGD